MYAQPDPFGWVPEAPGSLNRFVPDIDDLASMSASSGRTSYRRTTVTTLELGFSREARWWMQQGVGQGVTRLTEHLAEYSLIRFTASASRHKLLTRLPQEAIELLGGRSLITGLPANRSIHTLSTGGIRAIRGQALSRTAFDDFTHFSAGNAMSRQYAGRLGDDFLSHSFSWMGSRWFGATLAGVGDLGIQWFWPGTGDVWNYQEYGLTPGQFVGRGAVAAGGGLLAWGAAELTVTGFVAAGIITAPGTGAILVGVTAFIITEALYEWQVKPHLYEWLDLKGTGEP